MAGFQVMAEACQAVLDALAADGFPVAVKPLFVSAEGAVFGGETEADGADRFFRGAAIRSCDAGC